MAAGFSLPRASGFTCITCAHRPGRLSAAHDSKSSGVSWNRMQPRRSQASIPRSRQMLKLAAEEGNESIDEEAPLVELRGPPKYCVLRLLLPRVAVLWLLPVFWRLEALAHADP
eukprot:4656581-Prymnesium_polylepis.2